MAEGTKLTGFAPIKLDYQGYAFSFSSIFTKHLHVGIASFETESPNRIEVFQFQDPEFIKIASVDTKLPQTRICFAPHGTLTPVDSFISTDTAVHLYSIEDSTLKTEADIIVSEGNEPLTCADWNRIDTNCVITGCVDGTVSILDIQSQEVVSHLQAHEQPIFDVSFFSVSQTFVTTGLDGSLRVFDFRDLASSLIFYQSNMPIQRVITSPFQGYLIGALPYQSNRVIAVDTRFPGVPVAACGGNDTPITSFAWSRLSPARLYLAHEDCTIYSCDITDGQTDVEEVGRASSFIQSFAIGPMTMAVVTDHQIEFVDAKESPPPLARL